MLRNASTFLVNKFLLNTCWSPHGFSVQVELKLGEGGLPAGLTGMLDGHNAADTGGQR